jgi:hypothetical protein
LSSGLRPEGKDPSDCLFRALGTVSAIGPRENLSEIASMREGDFHDSKLVILENMVF